MLVYEAPLDCAAQELHVFLEADTPLGSNLQWQQLQPMHGSILEGVARLPKQLFGKRTLQLQTRTASCGCGNFNAHLCDCVSELL